MQTIFTIPVQDIIVNGLFAFVDVFFAFFLWIIDRRNKSRQEESLDIILEQVAKVNQFQTRTLALAIESLGIEVENIKTLIGKEPVTSIETDTVPISQPIQQTVNQTTTNESIADESFTNQLGKILSNQVTNLMRNIQDNITEAKTSTQKETYKMKKGLEFDLKTLLKNIDGLKDFMEITPPEEPKEQFPKNSKITEEPEPDKPPMRDSTKLSPDKTISSEIPKTDSPTLKEESDKELITDLEEKADNIKSIGDIDNLVNTIITTFGKEFKLNFDDSDRGLISKDTKQKIRKKVPPNRTESLKDKDEDQ